MTNNPIKTFLYNLMKYIIVIVGPTLMLTILLHIVEPSISRDGQYFLAFILSVPAGVILGIGLLVSNQLKKGKRNTMWPLTLSGMAVTILCLSMAYSSASSRGLSLSEFVSTALSLWCNVPMIFGIAVAVYGGISSRNSRDNKEIAEQANQPDAE
jgi:hypothetical protein